MLSGAPPPGASKRLEVLAVCDSPVVRQLVAAILSKDSDLSVATAFDWRQAEQRIRAAPPDVAVLCSERLGPDDPGARTIHELGIPLVSGALDLRAANVQVALLGLLAKIRDACPERPREPSGKESAASLGGGARGPEHDFPRTSKLVAVGASAGGTLALKAILQALPARAPAMAIVQHMSEHFTGEFARGLDRLCTIEVKEAEPGDAIVEGRALIAPGNRHLVVERRGTEYFVGLLDGPPVTRHRPSVNVLFRSIAQEAGPNAVGVILTGMGDDGADGLFEMKELGAATIAQNEATSVVFGMPRAAILRGGVEHIAALGDIPRAILKYARPKAPLSR